MAKGTRPSKHQFFAGAKRPKSPSASAVWHGGFGFQRISGQLSDALVEVVVDLAETNISTSDLISLKVGDIIATEKDVERPLVVSIEGQPKFHAKAGAFKGRKAIQVLGLINS